MKREGQDTQRRVGGNTQHTPRARARAHTRERARKKRRLYNVRRTVCGLPRDGAGVADDSRRRRAGRAWPRFHSHLVVHCVLYASRTRERRGRTRIRRRDAYNYSPHRRNATDCTERVLDESLSRAIHPPQPSSAYCGDHA